VNKITLFTNEHNAEKFYDGEVFVAYEQHSHSHGIRFEVSDNHIMKRYMGRCEIDTGSDSNL
jgi:hypothetical protein